jgi:hypothetical protein
LCAEIDRREFRDFTQIPQFYCPARITRRQLVALI